MLNSAFRDDIKNYQADVCRYDVNNDKLILDNSSYYAVKAEFNICFIIYKKNEKITSSRTYLGKPFVFFHTLAPSDLEVDVFLIRDVITWMKKVVFHVMTSLLCQ